MNKHSFVSTWLEVYRKLHEKTEILSKISSFLVALVAVLDFVHLLRSLIIYLFAGIDTSDLLLFRTEVGLLFQLTLFLIFLFRFISLRIKSRNYFGLNQGLWLIGLVTMFVYMSATKYHYFGSIWGERSNCLDCFYKDTFLSASNNFVVIVLLYFQLSIVKQIFFLMIASVMTIYQIPKKLGIKF